MDALEINANCVQWHVIIIDAMWSDVASHWRQLRVHTGAIWCNYLWLSTPHVYIVLERAGVWGPYCYWYMCWRWCITAAAAGNLPLYSYLLFNVSIKKWTISPVHVSHAVPFFQWKHVVFFANILLTSTTCLLLWCRLVKQQESL